MTTPAPGAPPRLPSPTRTVHRRAEGVSRAAEPASLSERTLDAPEHSGTITGAMGRRTRPVVRYEQHPAVTFTLNQDMAIGVAEVEPLVVRLALRGERPE